MKRTQGHPPVVPKRVARSRRMRASSPVLGPLVEFAVDVNVLADPLESESGDPLRVEEFADFLIGDGAKVMVLRPPDPAFRERLRRRLWCVHVLAQARYGRTTH